MVLLDLEFPVLVRNNRNVIQVVGRLRFPPLSITEVTHRQYFSNKKHFNEAVDMGLIEVIVIPQDEEEIKHEAEVVVDEVVEEVHGEPEATREKSIVAKFNDGELSWQQTVKEIGNITDKDVLADLFEEALQLGVKEDGIVVRSLRSALEDF